MVLLDSYRRVASSKHGTRVPAQLSRAAGDGRSLTDRPDRSAAAVDEVAFRHRGLPEAIMKDTTRGPSLGVLVWIDWDWTLSGTGSIDRVEGFSWKVEAARRRENGLAVRPVRGWGAAARGGLMRKNVRCDCFKVLRYA